MSRGGQNQPWLGTTVLGPLCANPNMKKFPFTDLSKLQCSRILGRTQNHTNRPQDAKRADSVWSKGLGVRAACGKCCSQISGCRKGPQGSSEPSAHFTEEGGGPEVMWPKSHGE